jgi:polyisoprenoid-binding protein YceI
MKLPTLALAAALFADAAHAAAPPTWVVDKATSSVRFSSSYNGAAFSGDFSRWDADIHFDPNNLAASSVTATIDVASAATGDADRDQAIPSPTFLSAAKFPRATFTARAFKSLGGNRYRAMGALTLRGLTKPLTLPFTLAITGAQARMNANVPLNRLAFGVGQDAWQKTAALPAVVNIAIAVTARRR